jgi:cleavage and polyadenylation specificity factor subunit 2
VCTAAMTVALQLTPLYGADGGALCCLLQVGPVNILLDCGWNEQFDLQLLEPLLK